MSRTVSPFKPVVPTLVEVEVARIALTRMTADHRIGLVDEETGETAGLPDAAVVLIRRLLADFAVGRGVAMIPLDAEVTTFQAAEILNVSRPYVIKLLDAGSIPFRLVGTHRRINLEDVLTFKTRSNRDADDARDELISQAQELKLGY